MTENNLENRADNLKKLSLLLSNGDEILGDDVRLSEQSPDSYVQAHRAELENRGIFEPVAGLSWIAIVDGLEKRGKLIELDWKESGEETVQAVLKLCVGDENVEQIRQSLEKIPPENFPETLDFFKRINQELELFEKALIIIDIDSDCYPLALVQLAAKPLVSELANRIEANRVRTFRISDVGEATHR